MSHGISAGHEGPSLSRQGPEDAAAVPSDVVLSVRDLRVRFTTETGRVHAVRGVGFDLMAGKTLGIVGESGSGKSAAALAIMGLLSPAADVSGSVRLAGKELLGLNDQAMCTYRGNSMAMVFQDPLSSLTPVHTVGAQIIEALTIHNPGMSRQAKEARAVELLGLVGIPGPRHRLKALPHEFSGGMRQRVVIAMAMANNPSLLIADEPTTALDTTIQAQVLEVLKAAQDETGAALVLITHDLGVAAGMADDILVMYAGRPVETGPVDELFGNPRMPYTLGLLGAVPRADAADRLPLVPIRGMPPRLAEEPTGCSFAPRCPLAAEPCLAGEPSLEPVAGKGAHRAACIKSGSLRGADSHDVYPVPAIPVSGYEAVPRAQRATVLQLIDVRKHFPLTKGTLLKRRVGTVKAVDGLSLDVREGECLSIVGESGSGKTTTLLEIMEFHEDQDGEIVVAGISNKSVADGKTRNAMRRRLQMVFQDSTSALDPRFTVYEVLAEPLRLAGMDRPGIKKRVLELLELVGLQPDQVNRFPGELSGGERQRIGIARALAVQPALVVLDEPVSALDASVKAGVINLLNRLRAELGLSYLLVSHDLSVVRHVSNRVAVMYLGKIVEVGDVDRVFAAPRHPYTRALLSAIPVPDPRLERTRKRIVLQGDLPSPQDTPDGCNFAGRCPVFAVLPPSKQEKCLATEPPLVHMEERGAQGPQDVVDQRFSCFYPEGNYDGDVPETHDSAGHAP